jgi:cold shock protein
VVNDLGIVKWFSSEKGYGFIKPEDGGDDVFVHHTGIIGPVGKSNLKADDRVSYRVERDRNDRLKAVDVRLV